MFTLPKWSRSLRGSGGPSFRPRVEALEDRSLPSALPAFPGAEGFGAYATGGRGGSVYHVTNLNDSGPGSFRDAVSHNNRIVVFDVGGTIQLNSAVSVHSNLTLAGQTAPGDGIAVIGREVSFSNSSNDIVRYLRFRQGSLDPDTGKSSVNITNGSNMIFDHVSVEFGQWDNLDLNGSSNITFQDCILADPIGQQFNAHVTSSNVSFLGDVWSSAHNRNPLAKGDTQYVNNVIYNFQAGYTVANTSGVFHHDIVNNYFITGPSTTNAGDAFYQMNSNQSVYASGNLEDSNKDGTLNGGPVTPGGVTHLSSPWSPTTSALPTLGAADAYAADVATAGASLRRDAVDALVIADVTSLGKTGHLWTNQTQTGLDNGGYGTLNGGTPLPDSDGDGMADVWEVAYGLDPNNPADANGDFDGTGYTNVEKYVNGLADGSYGWVPAPRQFGDVGAVGLAGSARYTGSGNYVVSGSGAGIGGTSDQFQLVWEYLSGDGSLTAELAAQNYTDPKAEAGVMFRNPSGAGAAFAAVGATPDGHVFFRWRGSDGGSATYAVAYATVPVWVQLARAGNSFTASYSADGATWVQIGTPRTVNLSTTALAGLDVTATNNAALSTAAFADVVLTAPVSLSASFNATGLVSDGATFGGGLDGNGNAYSADLLGPTVSAGGAAFNLGPANANNVAQAAGQTVTLRPGQFSTLAFLGTAVNGSQPGQTFVVNYADGSSDTFTKDLSDWLAPQGYAGETVAASLPYRDVSGGTTDGTANYLYLYSFTLNPSKVVSSLTLPSNANVMILALDLLS
jgi:hypothetical protein